MFVCCLEDRQRTNNVLHDRYLPAVGIMSLILWKQLRITFLLKSK